MKNFNFFEVSRAASHASYSNSDKCSENITLVVQVADGIERFDIDEDYLFACKKTFARHAQGRKPVEKVIITIKKESDADSSSVRKDAVGFATFYNEHVSKHEGDYYWPAALCFQVFVNNELFNRIYSNISNKLYVVHVSLKAKAEQEGELKFGPDFDGSHIIWKRTNDDSRLHLDNFDISFSQTDTLASEADEDKENNKNAMITKLFKELNVMRVCLTIISIAVAIEIFARLFH